MKVRVFVSDTTDPWFNLAVEDWIFLDFNDVDHVLFLWRNAETVVIGRSQNPWLECHLEKMQQDQVKLARRQSGGGAVFHDLGNTNFTFMSKKEHYNKEANNKIILTALERLGIVAQAQGRNDLVVTHQGEWRKFSGSAFKEKVDRCFHHGTLLVSTDIGRLNEYLNPHPLKLKAKGVQSVRSRVVNLTKINPTLNHALLSQAILNAFTEYYQVEAKAEHIDVSLVQSQPQLRPRYQQLASWEWLYGNTLPFSHQFEARFDWATLDLRLQVEAGTIVAAQCFTDCLDVSFVAFLEEQLKNVPYCSLKLKQRFDCLMQAYPQYHSYCTDVMSLLRSQIKPEQ